MACVGRQRGISIDFLLLLHRPLLLHDAPLASLSPPHALHAASINPTYHFGKRHEDTAELKDEVRKAARLDSKEKENERERGAEVCMPRPAWHPCGLCALARLS